MLTEQQRKARKFGIGGTDVAAICGYSQYKTALDVYLEKISDEDKPDKLNRNMLAGNAAEKYVLERFAETNELTAMEDTRIKDTDHPWRLGNIDSIMKDKEGNIYIVDAKTTSASDDDFFEKWGKEDSSIVPIDYLFQIAYYCALYPISVGAYFPVLRWDKFSGDEIEFRIYKYKSHEALQKEVLDKIDHFWNNHVLPRVPPPPVTLAEAQRLYSMSGMPERKEILKKVASADDTVAFFKMKELNQKISELEKERDTEKFKLITSLKDHDMLIDDANNKLATYKWQSNKRVNMQLLERDYKTIRDKLIEDKPTRVFRV